MKAEHWRGKLLLGKLSTDFFTKALSGSCLLAQRLRPSRGMLTVSLLLAFSLGGCQCDDDNLEEVTGGASGVICNPVTGAPAPAVSVSTSFVVDDGTEVIRTGETDEAGMFSMTRITEGTHTFLVQAELFSFDFELAVTPHTEAVFNDPGCRELALPAGTGALAGQICNRHVGAFVEGAIVSIILSDGESLVTNTDAEGNFALEEIPAGTHVVYVQADGYSRTHQVEIIAGEQTLLEAQQRACEPPDPGTTGFVLGRVCLDAASGEGLGGVKVTLLEPIDGFVFEDETLDDGSFRIVGIPAPRTVTVRAEKGDFFYEWANVEIFTQLDNPEGSVLDDGAQGCIELEPSADVRYLVIDGFYDKIQNVLERMGLQDVSVVSGNPLDPTELWASQIFGNLSDLLEFDAVFVNCGVSELEFIGAIDPLVAENLRAYVRQGGSLYVSDQAYDLIELVWPERIDFLLADTSRSAAELGVDGSYVMTVEDPGLEAFVGADEVTIDFDFGYFSLIQEVQPDTTVYLRADIPYYVNGSTTVLEGVPVTVGFTDGPPGVGGRVIFTSFHQENDAVTGEPETLDGPEDAVLRYLIFAL